LKETEGGAYSSSEAERGREMLWNWYTRTKKDKVEKEKRLHRRSQRVRDENYGKHGGRGREVTHVMLKNPSVA